MPVNFGKQKLRKIFNNLAPQKINVLFDQRVKAGVLSKLVVFNKAGYM
jgi:hypothetical protein